MNSTQTFKIPEPKEDLCECRFCGVKSPIVECAGIYHCANLICTGPGAAWFRTKCETYKEVEGGRHTVDSEEWKWRAKKYLKDNPKSNYIIKRPRVKQ